jgi:hypothetical protein
MASAAHQDRPTVQLLHELPDGSSHVDWLLATDPAGERPLITFRLPGRVDELEAGEVMDGQRIADHRPAYLGYEGPISGGRGTVRRLRSGVVKTLRKSEEIWLLEVLWEEGGDAPVRQRLRIERHGAESRIVAETA